MIANRLVPRLFFASDNPLQDPVTAKAKEYTVTLLSTVMDDWPVSSTANIPLSFVKPFDQMPTFPTNSMTESALSRIVTMVINHLIQSVCRQVTVSAYYLD